LRIAEQVGWLAIMTIIKLIPERIFMKLNI
jgi:hypothetical protein